jgi:WD40 repeat protein
MKEFARSLLLALIIVVSAVGSLTIAQSPTPSPPDKRGLGIDTGSSPGISQTDPSKSKEARPELVLQTGYNNFFGATRLVFSPDGRLLATSTFRSSTIKLWETATGRELRNLSSGGQNSTGLSTVFAFSSNGRWLAASAGNNSVKVWEVISGREVQTLSGAQASFMSSLGISFIAFSTDSRKLVTVSDAIRVWDTTSWRETKTVETASMNVSAFTGGEGGMALSPDGNQLAHVSTEDGKTQIEVLDLTTGREVRSVELPHDQIDSLELCFKADGSMVAAGIVNKKLKIWDITTKASERDLGPTLKDYSLLTYALVEEGLKTPAADNEPKDGLLSAREWLDFATERVPQMQEEKMKQSRGLLRFITQV